MKWLKSLTGLTVLMEEVGWTDTKSYAYKTYTKFRVAANRTLKSILISVNARLGLFDTPELNMLTADDTINLTSIGRTKDRAVLLWSVNTDRFTGWTGKYILYTGDE